jgi:hypothetical protein
MMVENMKIDSAIVWIRKTFDTYEEATAILDAAKVLGLGVRLYVSGSCKVEGWEKVRGGKFAGDVGFFLKEEVVVSYRSKNPLLLDGEEEWYMSLLHSDRPKVTLVDHESTPGVFYAELEIGTDD